MPTSNFQPNRLLDPGCWYKFTYLMANNADLDQLSQLIWIYTVCKDRAYPGSAGPGLRLMMMIWCFKHLSRLFRSYRDDRRVIMKGSEQWSGIVCHEVKSTSRRIQTSWSEAGHFNKLNYHIHPNSRTYPCKCTVKQFCNLQITTCVLFVYFIKAYVVGTHLNSINLTMQFSWVPTTYAFITKIRKHIA